MAESETGTTLPLFPLPVVLFPKLRLPLHIFEERYRDMIGRCIETEAYFGVVFSHEDQVYEWGCSARVEEVIKRFPNGEFDVMCLGVRRFRIERFIDDKAYLQGAIRFFEDDPSSDSETHSWEQAELLDKIYEFCQSVVKDRNLIEKIRMTVQGSEALPSFVLVHQMGMDPRFMQELLEVPSEFGRLEKIYHHLREYSPSPGSEEEPGFDPFMGGNGKSAP